ncbi:hypothetical protein [Algoriphagus litoralis]|uniref:hypothetical protein n=1 Tax=Algoriphagus litoralis TaxID=2202829 RepID=UPI000DBAA456|nr:hypothetical protein [Algoriphagus litoralis]
MKFTNYKSAIHNFADSFQRVDYSKSGKLAINVLIHLNNLKLKPTATFDFIFKTIKPEEAITKESERLLNDYLNWLPEHFKNHNCNLDKLEKLTIVISADFEKAFYPQGMNKAKQISLQTKTNWKAANRDEEIIEIILNEIVDDYYLKTGIPEM